MSELGHLADVGRLVRIGVAGGTYPGLHNGCVVLHRFIHIGDVGQHLVFDLDQFESLLGGFRIDRSHCSNRMSVVQRPAASHAVFEDIEHVPLAFHQVRQIGARDDGFHARQLFSLAGVDLLDLGMCVWRAEDQTHQLTSSRGVRAVARATRNLVQTIRARHPCADNLEGLICETRISCHCSFS